MLPNRMKNFLVINFLTEKRYINSMLVYIVYDYTQQGRTIRCQVNAGVTGRKIVKTVNRRNGVLTGVTLFAHDFKFLFELTRKSEFEIVFIQGNQSLDTLQNGLASLVHFPITLLLFRLKLKSYQLQY